MNTLIQIWITIKKNLKCNGTISTSVYTMKNNVSMIDNKDNLVKSDSKPREFSHKQFGDSSP